MAQIRIKTTWFRKDAGRAEDETASVLALTFWKMASKAVDDISKADYDIVNPGRGFGGHLPKCQGKHTCGFVFRTPCILAKPRGFNPYLSH